MSATNVSADCPGSSVTGESTECVTTADGTAPVNAIRQSLIDITVVLPTGKNVIITSINPSEPTSLIRQTLQEYQESALYTSYVLETADGAAISDYVEIANYAPIDEEITNMKVLLIPAPYDIRKCRLQLRRIRDMIAYPPTLKGASSDSDVTDHSKSISVALSDDCNAVASSAETVVSAGADKVSVTDGIEARSEISPRNGADESSEETKERGIIDEAQDEEEDFTAEELAGCDPTAEFETSVEVDSNSSSNEVKAVTPDEKSTDGTVEVALKDDGSEQKVVDYLTIEKVKDDASKTKIKGDKAPYNDGIKVTAMGSEVSSTVKKAMQKNKALPSETELFSPLSLQNFYRQTLLRVGSAQGGAKSTDISEGKVPSQCVKSVSASGWNPPPAFRKTQGDLLYIEAVTDEGVFHITNTPSGFYINRSTRQVFDPRPALHPHFSHEIFNTLLGVSASLRASWRQQSLLPSPPQTEAEEEARQAKGGDKLPGALDVISTICSQGREELMFVKLPWNVPTPETFLPSQGAAETAAVKQRNDSKSNKLAYAASNASSSSSSSADKRLSHTYNISRLHDDLCDHFGAEDPGAPREWNEEMQSIRAFKCAEMPDKVMRAKFIHKIYQEFNDAVKAGAVAIAEGNIAPMNPVDEEKTQVFVYDNIFYSRAVDTKDNFKICQGDGANRKLAGHDLRNQRLIQSLEIEGLCTVLSCVVDFKGERLIGQTIIPGVLQISEHSARLLYGALELGKRLSVKNEGLKVMNALFSRLFIAQRNVAAVPTVTIFPAEEDSEVVAPIVPLGMGFFGAIDLEENQASCVKIDFEDEAVEESSEVVPHVGCLEIKVLKGTDGRVYALDAMRLTPRDANYVKGPKGTGNISADALGLVNDNIAQTHVLRHELISSYAQHKASLLRQELIQKRILSNAKKNAKEEVPEEALKKLEIPTAAATAPKDNNESSAAAEGVVKTEVAASVLATVEAETKEEVQPALEGGAEEGSARDLEDELFGSELNEMFAKITPASVAQSLQLNANCFIDGFECDVDPAVALKDEETARALADFLFKQVLVSLTEQIRVGDLTPLEHDGMVQLLHTYGVNMRYLGRMALLAHTQEEQDRELLLTNRQRIQAMPHYWLEMLETEVLARCFKHHLSRIFRENKAIKQCPARTIATLLNHILGSSNGSDAASSSSSSADYDVLLSASGDSASYGDSDHKMKKKKSKKRRTDAEEISCPIPQPLDAGGSRSECLSALRILAASKFGMEKFALITFTQEEPVPSEGVSVQLLDQRVSRITLLRRLCQIGGLRVLSRDIDFSLSCPFTADDIITVVPLVKSAQQQIPLPEVRELISTARGLLEEGNLAGAFELTQDASQLLHQITGPLHAETAMSMNLMTQVLLEAGDNSLALSTACKSLSVCVQLLGLDSQDAAQHHGQVAALLADRGRPMAAVQHLLSMKYLVELLGGPRHPEMVNVYLRLVGVYDEAGEYSTAQSLLSKAKALSQDVAKQCMISSTIAEIFHRMGELSAAVTEQRGVLRIMEQLYGVEDEKTAEAKARLQKYLRKLTIDNVNTAREMMVLKKQIFESNAPDRKVVKVVEKTIEILDDTDRKDDKKKSGSKKTKKNKNKK